MSISPEIITVIVAGVFAFAGGALAQFTSRKLTAAQAENFLAEAEKMRAEAENLRWQSEQAAAEREADKKALAEALDRLDEIEKQRKIAYENSLAEKQRWIDAQEALAEAEFMNLTMSEDERNAQDAAIREYDEERRRAGYNDFAEGPQ